MTNSNDAWERFLKEEQIRIQNEKRSRASEGTNDQEKNDIIHLSSCRNTPNLGQQITLRRNDDKQKIVFESKVGADGNQGCLPGPGARRIIILIVIYAVVVTAIGSFLAHLSFGLPGYVVRIYSLHI